jgi:beta-mannanase
LAAGCVAAAAAAGTSSPATAATPSAELIGLHLDDSSNTSTAQAAYKDAVLSAEQDAGRRFDVVSTSPYGFGAAFPSWREPWLLTAGIEPVINWSTATTTGIVKGSKDATLIARADALRGLAQPVILEFAPSMDQLPSTVVPSAASFVAAWQHVHNVFAAEGANNVSFAWCPSATAWANGAAAAYYPGAAYVDDVCAQGATVDPSVSFQSEFTPFATAASGYGKPLMVSSFGVSESSDPSAKAQWITNAYAALTGPLSSITTAVQDGTGTAAVTTSTAADSAWAAALSQPALHPTQTTTLPTGPLVPASGSMLGALLTKANPATEQSEWNALESQSNNNVQMYDTIQPWGATIPTWRESWALSQGRIPMISWGGTTTTDIESGADDAYITQSATAIKALGGQVFLRWFWEMDGTAFASQAISPADFIGAWRHIRAIFNQVGATNVTWVWSPTAYGITNGKAQAFYPGNDQVDWVAADGFNMYPGVPGTSAQSFATIFTPFYAFGLSTGKPMMVGATGCDEDPNNPTAKAAWLEGMAKTLRVLMPGIRAVNYLDDVSSTYSDPTLSLDWSVGTSPAAQNAWTDITTQAPFTG